MFRQITLKLDFKKAKMKRILIVLSIICMSYMQGKAQCVGTVTYTTNPAPIAGGYAAGTVVQVCCTLISFDMAGSNWFEGFSVNLGQGWLPGSLNGVTAPVNLSGGGGQWIWVNTPFTANGNLFGPGYFFDLNMNGISNDDFGDMGNGPWSMCFNLTVGNNIDSSLALDILLLPDGVAGSWGSNACGALVTPIIPNTIIVGMITSLKKFPDILRQDFKIYPNPAKDFITIETNEQSIGKQLKMYDVYGHLLLSTTITGIRYTIANLDLAKGIYFICIDEHYFSEKVIID